MLNWAKKINSASFLLETSFNEQNNFQKTSLKKFIFRTPLKFQKVTTIIYIKKKKKKHFHFSL